MIPTGIKLSCCGSFRLIQIDFGHAVTIEVIFNGFKE